MLDTKRNLVTRFEFLHTDILQFLCTNPPYFICGASENNIIIS